jgi:hypothetical protein
MSESTNVRANPSDYARRVLSATLALITATLFFLGTRAFAHTVTFSVSKAGYVIVPLGMFIVGILLIPLMSQVHKQWVLADPHRRARERAHDEAEEKRMRLSTNESPSVRRQKEADARRLEHESAAREAAGRAHAARLPPSTAS